MSSTDIEEFDLMTSDEAINMILARIKSAWDPTWDRFKLIKLMHQRCVRKPLIVLEHGKQLLKHWEKSGSDLPERWQAYEWVGVAALDAYDPYSNECKAALVKRFPDSLRVKRFVALDLENAEEWKDAYLAYEEILKADPVNAHARKRKAVMLREQGRFEDAIQELCAYTDIFAEDISAWTSLYELYAWLGEWRYARFAAEELVLIKPEHYLYHILVADAAYGAHTSSQNETKVSTNVAGKRNANVNDAKAGDVSSPLQIALSHYAQSLQLKKEGNRRAAYGLTQCIKQRTSPGPNDSALLELSTQVLNAL